MADWRSLPWVRMAKFGTTTKSLEAGRDGLASALRGVGTSLQELASTGTDDLRYSWSDPTSQCGICGRILPALPGRGAEVVWAEDLWRWRPRSGLSWMAGWRSLGSA